MSCTRHLTAAAFTMLCISTPLVQAADNDWPITVLGGNVLSDSDDVDTGPLLHLGFGHALTQRIGYEVALSYSNLAIKDNGGDNYERFGLGGSLHYLLKDRSANTVPYALAGMSAIRARLDGAGDNLAYSPAIETGLGVVHHLRHTWVDLKAEARYRYDLHSVTSELDNDNFYDWTIGLGLVFNPGRQSAGNAAAAGNAQASNAPKTLAPVLFELDQARLTAEARDTLDQVADILKADSALTVTITGHADDTGPADYNLRLSQRRAQSARRHLISTGIAASRVKLRAVGERQPVASNSNNFGRQRNRRIDIELR